MVRGRHLLLVALSLSLPTVSCKRIAKRNTVGYVIGPTSQIEQYKDSDTSSERRKIAQSSVLIATKLKTKKRKFCSASLIDAPSDDGKGSLRVLTNYHCFAKSTAEGEVSDELLEEACNETSVYFGFTYEDAEKVKIRKCLPGSLRTDPVGDLAIFTLDEAAPEGFGSITLWKGEDVPKERKVYIIHYPDVEENYTRVAQDGAHLPAASITKDDCVTKGGFTAEEWPLDHTLPFSFKHTCDLIHGSSGSGLIDVLSNEILGVNWGGIELKYKNHSETFNAATQASYVQAFLDDNTSEIRAEAKRKSDAAERNGKENKEANMNLKSMCGTITGMPTGSYGFSALAMLIFSLLLPVLWVFRKS